MEGQAQTTDSSSYIAPVITTGNTGSTGFTSPLSDGDDQSWKAKYDGLQGAYKNDRQRYGQEIEGLRAAKDDYETRLSKLQAAMQASEVQLQELPTLKQTLTEKEQTLASVTARLERQDLLLKHRVFDDALTKLVISSQLPLEELETTIAAFTQASAAQQQAAIARAAEGSVASSNPPTSTGGQDQLKALQEKMELATREGRYDGPDGFWQLNDQYVRLTAELRGK
jgi:hypothetical protein